MENDRSYFARRASEERTAAEKAKGKARLAHEEMAERYRVLADADGQDRVGPQPVC